MVTRAELAPWLVRLARTRTRVRLSRAALEALAIVAYKQPVSRPEIDAVRGVNSEGVLDNLLERRLVRIAGRKDAPGRPFLFETTREFLVAFGLRDLDDLPKVEGELVLPDLAAERGERRRPRSPEMAKLRLNKILAQAGRTSRRGGDRLILDGRVAVNGAVTREPGTLADPLTDIITVDGRPLPAREPLHYVLLNKPAGYVTSRHDPRGRAVVTDLVRAPVRLYPVGRLDYDVEGVLLLTNDGPLTHRLLHPRYRIARLYEASVRGRVTAADLPRWRQGVMLEDGRACPTAVELVRSGRDREPAPRRLHGGAQARGQAVRRGAGAPGASPAADRLRPHRLGRLPRGRSRPLSLAEIRALRRAAVGATHASEAATLVAPLGGVCL